MDKIVIEKLNVNQAKETSVVLALAFANTPNTLTVWENPSSEKALRATAKIFNSAKLSRKFSNVYVAKINGKIVGAINYTVSPNCQPSMGEQLKSLPSLIFSFGKALPKAFNILSAWGKHDPKEKHIHIGPLGILPEYKGKGIGTQLLQHALKITDEQNIPCYLETDATRNVQLYERNGFKVTKTITVNNITNWLMWRNVNAI
jgi:ribosomal protein S18 acetylase RimI-like enzyme